MCLLEWPGKTFAATEKDAEGCTDQKGFHGNYDGRRTASGDFMVQLIGMGMNDWVGKKKTSWINF